MNFTEAMRVRFGLSDESLDAIRDAMEEVRYPKGETIVGEGCRNDSVYFVGEGFVRSYAWREGICRTFRFAFAGEPALTASASPGRISRLTLEASADSLLLRIPCGRLEALYRQSVELANWGRLLAEEQLADYEHYFLDYYWADKATQYDTLVREYPALLRNASLKEIASYLNITPQSLSRIRARRR